MFFSPNKLRRQQLLAEPFPEHWLPYLQANVLLYQTLSEVEQAKLRDTLRILIAEKYWEGCRGLEMTEEIQVTVAAQASLLLLGFDDYYFDELQTVLLYPGGFLAEDPYRRTERLEHVIGEAHHKGPVILSWWHALWGGRRRTRSNLVVHEFAHKLAELGDPNEGIPVIADADLERRWRKVFPAEYATLCDDVDWGRATVMDAYGATNPAEFFAVSTECFFLQPRRLRRHHRELYRLFTEWYGQDPAMRRLPEASLSKATTNEREYIDHAMKEVNAVIRLHPDSVEAYHQRAAWHHKLGDLDRALEDYTTVIRLAPDTAEPYCDRGEVYLDKGCYDEALADFDRAIRIWPDLGRAYRQRGSTYAKKGDYQKAIANFTRVLESDPHDADAYRHRALAYAALGEEDRAQRDRVRARKLSRGRRA